MKTGILLQLSVDRARSLDRVLGEWEPDLASPDEAKIAELERWGGQFAVVGTNFLELARDLKLASAMEYEDAVRGRRTSSALRRIRRISEEVFRLVLRNLDDLLHVHEYYEQHTGRSLPGHAALLQARAAHHELQERLKAEWPVCTEEEAAEALAAAERGEATDLAEAFAAIAGVSRDAWLERVATHKGKG